MMICKPNRIFLKQDKFQCLSHRVTSSDSECSYFTGSNGKPFFIDSTPDPVMGISSYMTYLPGQVIKYKIDYVADDSVSCLNVKTVI
jgi:hypothetical protein